MKNRVYESSYATKQAICISLKELMAQKPLDKITVGEIMNGCGMIRQHFYYHFDDIYDLVRWMFQEEAVSLLKRQEGALLWQEGLLQLFQYIQENREVCLCVLNSLSRPYLKRFFFSDIYALVRCSAAAIGESLGLKEDSDVLEMITHFYTVALAGMMESWLLGEVDRTPEEMIRFFDTLIQNQIRGAAAQTNVQAQIKKGDHFSEKTEGGAPAAERTEHRAPAAEEIF